MKQLGTCPYLASMVLAAMLTGCGGVLHDISSWSGGSDQKPAIQSLQVADRTIRPTRPPHAAPTDPTLIVTAGATIPFACLATDGDADPLSFTWVHPSSGTFSTPVATATTSNTTGSTTTTTVVALPWGGSADSGGYGSSDPTAQQVMQWNTTGVASGDYYVSCTVSDGRTGVDEMAVLIRVIGGANRAPSASLAPDKLDIAAGDATHVFTCTGKDPEDDPMTYKFFADRGKLNSGDATEKASTATYTAPAVAGTDTLYCVVSDGKGGYALATATVTVKTP